MKTIKLKYISILLLGTLPFSYFAYGSDQENDEGVRSDQGRHGRRKYQCLPGEGRCYGFRSKHGFNRPPEGGGMGRGHHMHDKFGHGLHHGPGGKFDHGSQPRQLTEEDKRLLQGYEDFNGNFALMVPLFTDRFAKQLEYRYKRLTKKQSQQPEEPEQPKEPKEPKQSEKSEEPEKLQQD